MDPVHVLNRSYLRFTVSPSSYYSRFFKSSSTTPNSVTTVTSPLTTQKRKEPRALVDTSLKSGSRCSKRECEGGQHSFVDLVQVAPQLEVTLNLRVGDADSDPHLPPNDLEGEWLVNKNLLHEFNSLISQIRLVCNAAVLPAFNNLVANDTKDDAVAEILNNRYIMPQESCFYMSDLGQIRNLIPALTDSGFNLIVVDPPQENSSAHRKSSFFEGSLDHNVINVERSYVVLLRELFAAWGVSYAATFYWLKVISHKVKKNGSWICDLDLFHHRPYECLILGYSPRKVNNTDNQSKFKPVNNDHVIMSIPGDYSRKPPIADLLLEYVPGFKPSRCIELFAREIMAGWVAWGNEPLYFQDSKYFVKKMDQ
ncbi:Methyltransferase-like protein 2 [Glycine soja]